MTIFSFDRDLPTAYFNTHINLIGITQDCTLPSCGNFDVLYTLDEELQTTDAQLFSF